MCSMTCQGDASPMASTGSVRFKGYRDKSLLHVLNLCPGLPGLSEPVKRLLKRSPFCHHLTHGFLNTKIKENHHFQGNVQVYNVRIPAIKRHPKCPPLSAWSLLSLDDWVPEIQTCHAGVRRQQIPVHCFGVATLPSHHHVHYPELG